eukprot:TRINITY_DN55969_c0_g1_i1.p1 TRINITY_DN55969_c0_g1~~TRINITY_DN55969_c0_g1_i1.p1  ORF type:complete len:470 (+),score=264.20 TRINITY_DN55969_c0_g1_i1:94-1503(+)
MPPGKGKEVKEVKEDPAEAAKNLQQEEAERQQQRDEVAKTLERAKKLRNYFQTERDKVAKFWDISMKQLQCARYELMNQDREIEEMEEKHQIEMKVYKQKVRHLLYEHKVQVQELRERSQEGLADAEKQHEKTVRDFRLEKARRRKEFQAEQNQHVESVQTSRNMHQSMLTTQDRQNKKAMQDMQENFEKKLTLLHSELELRRRAEIHEIEERKNEHIKELVHKHEGAFQEIKEYYNDITSNNLDLIKSLKEEVANMKKNESYNIRLMYEIAQENKKLKDPLGKAEKEVDSLRHQLANYEKDKMSLQNARSRLRVLEQQYKQLERDHESLKAKYKSVDDDKTSLVTRFQDSLRIVQDLAGSKNKTMQQRLDDIKVSLEKKDVKLGAVLHAANLEPVALDVVTRKLEDMLETKNRAIKDLHFELEKVKWQHRDVVRQYENLCKGHQLPPLDLAQLGLLKTYVLDEGQRLA